jgi:hypothetical protein
MPWRLSADRQGRFSRRLLRHRYGAVLNLPDVPTVNAAKWLIGFKEAWLQLAV